MQQIVHRVNTVEQLCALPPHYGVELDLRDRGDRLVLQHDPFRDGEDFETYLGSYHHGLMVLNIKSERIEERVIALVRKYGVREYFFLDSSVPMQFLLSQRGEHNIAVRFSELESLDSVLLMQGRARWVWVDCFTRLPIDIESYKALKAAGFRLCLVSPELQGRPEDVAVYQARLKAEGIVMDAVCSKQALISTWDPS